MSPEQYEEICFQIITFAGEARSCFVEALRHAKDADKTKARELLEEGNQQLITTAIINATFSVGLARALLKVVPSSSAFIPTKPPAAILKK